MPSHLIHGTLTQMYHDLDGAPWNFATWKALTGVHHGLFHEDDNKLPNGWNRQTAKDIFSFFDQFRALMTEEEKISFSSGKKKGRYVPGRTAWRNWVTGVWKARKIHEMISDVLSTENLHPYTLLAQSDSSDTWPPANMWVPLAIDPVALALFGAECYADGVERLRGSLRNTTGALITRTWLVLYNGLKRSKKRIDTLESAALQAFEDLDRDKLTKAKLKTVVDKVLKWKQVVEALRTKEGDRKIQEMESELGKLMVGLDQKVKPTSSKKSKSLCRVTAQMLQSLASEEDVADIINLYRDCFNPLAGDSSQLEDQVSSISFEFGILSGVADPGTEVESTMLSSHLSKNLGFLKNIPILFNTHRNVGGVTPWDDPSAFQNVDNDEAFTPNELRWHQLAGAHAILRRLFSAEPSRARPGILVADAVGLGKTLQSLAVIAWLTECVGRQLNGNGSPLPPILTERPYLTESNSIPNKPHLIVVPGTVLSQWASEIRIFLNPKAFDLFIYQTGEDFRTDFWSDSGPFAQSKQPRANKVILAPHSALFQEYNLLYLLRKSLAKELPWRAPLRTPTYDSIVQKTLFRLNFLSVTIDEAHEFRNVGPKHSSALEILQNAKIRMIMTATPLQTSTKDLASMGRLVGIDFFFSQKAFDEEKIDMKDLRRAKAALGEDHDPLEVKEIADDPIREAQAAIALRIQGQFEQRVLRRTIDSKNPSGENLVRLPKLHEHTVLLELQSFEREIHSELSEQLRDKLSSCTTMKVFSSSFYLPSRMGATYPRLSLKDKIPRFKTPEDWESRKSTKVDICARMCRHLLSRDDAPRMVFEGGTVIFPEVPIPKPGERVSQDIKLLVYQEFPSFGPLVKDVFGLYGIRFLYMDGNATYAARAKMVNTFNNDPSNRVLFFTSVGASGLPVPLEKRMVPKNVTSTFTLEPKPVEKFSTHLPNDSHCSHPNVDKVKEITGESDLSAMITKSLPTSLPTFAPRIKDQYDAPKIPREAEVGQRRGRPQYGREPDSPEAQKAKKKPRLELVSYASSPEKQATSGRLSPDSEGEMFDNRTETTLGAQTLGNHRRSEDIQALGAQHKGDPDGRLADVIMSGSQPINSLPPSFSTANRSNETLPIASDDKIEERINREPCGSKAMFWENLRAQGKRISYDDLPMSKTPRINSLSQSFSTASISNDSFPIASNIEDEQASDGSQIMIWANPRVDNPIATTAPLSFGAHPMSSTPSPSAVFQRSLLEHTSDIEGQEAQAKQEKRQLKALLTEKIHATAKARNEEEKLRYERLRDLKRKLVREKVSADGRSSVTRQYDTPDIRQPSILGQSGRLSPPPRTTPSRNPFSRNSLKKQMKSRWE